ncbi:MULTISPECIES: ATP-binding cassette domain-containing protein [Pseudomonas]|uniref:ABC transporter ATP-binding protein n=1 Tax=Pseudomonas soli TaxID=1306993 RepID=A0A2V4I2S6_9PSED|nr:MULTISPECIES: ATP-binding cassette domain-containing protein [Pseudomonas]PYB84101.1 ABC transporter ATP-binding protein [Pseudomonas soli]PZW75558.1 putative AbiEii toxin of type IV toxin-antitoxin system [Pseudomonas sp. 2848]
MAMIELHGVGLHHGRKHLFSELDARIEWGQRIAIIGDNGSGKSSLLRLLQGSLAPSEGHIERHGGLRVGHVAQVLDGESSLSGGQRVNQALSQALALSPDLLLLDEPTNHLDAANRRSLSRMLEHFHGTLVLVTHDVALMNQTCDTLWHVHHGRLDVFNGSHADYMAERDLQRGVLDKRIAEVRRARDDAHDSLMQEQARAAGARKRGVKAIQNSKWATVRSPTKLGRGNTTAGRKQAQILQQQRELGEQLAELRPEPVIVPRFHLPAMGQSSRVLIQVRGGSVGYADAPVLSGIDLQLEGGERLALTGNNGSGKSTLARAILGDPRVWRRGDWLLPAPEQVGYIDQHYDTLPADANVQEALGRIVRDWPLEQLRAHLADFLFRQADAVQTPVAGLSGGEKARLSLACIAARPPQLLILDEPTNNLDLRMRTHLLEVLVDYPNALLVISHDQDFLDGLGIDRHFHCARDHSAKGQ